MTDPDAIKAARRQLSRLPADHPEVMDANEMLDRAALELAQGNTGMAGNLIFKAGMCAALAAVDPLLEQGRQHNYREMSRQSGLEQANYNDQRSEVQQLARTLRNKGHGYSEAISEIQSSRVTKVTEGTLKQWLKGVYPPAERPKPGRPKKNK